MGRIVMFAPAALLLVAGCITESIWQEHNDGGDGDCQCQQAGLLQCSSDRTALLACDGCDWVNKDCAAHCKQQGLGASTGCVSDATKKAACACAPPRGKWGSRCKGANDCDAGLICLTVQGTPAYCSKTCPQLMQQCSGVPGKTAAFCQSTGGGQKACVFLCKARVGTGPPTEFPCPSGLRCIPVSGKPGTSICVP